jgi:hypothetical protein
MPESIDPMTGNGTQTIMVAEPCTCGATKWFYCECLCVARYVVDVYDGVPNEKQIASIREAHPGMTLIY